MTYFSLFVFVPVVLGNLWPASLLTGNQTTVNATVITEPTLPPDRSVLFDSEGRSAPTHVDLYKDPETSRGCRHFFIFATREGPEDPFSPTRLKCNVLLFSSHQIPQLSVIRGKQGLCLYSRPIGMHIDKGSAFCQRWDNRAEATWGYDQSEETSGGHGQQIPNLYTVILEVATSYLALLLLGYDPVVFFQWSVCSEICRAVCKTVGWGGSGKHAGVSMISTAAVWLVVCLTASAAPPRGFTQAMVGLGSVGVAAALHTCVTSSASVEARGLYRCLEGAATGRWSAGLRAEADIRGVPLKNKK
uniref:TRP C-terminal domain-containing protein n=1 Tax=Chromera velia CCMP2878 TaxID=1169474 RepID=A0A0G4H963_9ALVE|eukprot:Cvel_5951.t1-p1 / transcript=Cvel_5951.t1 / gene=Cvel_5951 / organism=Chromera_velia_CCMP2878 / gene_product=hypothetical protein / transcript_product=hypothetical protein / location=Cvel_scaffold284:85992-87510(+) / protein_length=302 / sequence_SO=supercontig / SO=protein_coding / is_pseudo=false